MTNLRPAAPAEQQLRRRAEQVSCELAAQDAAWGTGGWTRRRFIAGAGMVGAATLAAQLVTSRVAFGATTPDGDVDTSSNTLIVVFLRGAADGLRILTPYSSDLGLTYLRQVRPQLVPTNVQALGNGWALNAALQPLYSTLWNTGELAFIPAISTPGISRSHFQAQQFLEKGGYDRATDGWLDRLLAKLGPGTTFRAVSVGSATPMSMIGNETTLSFEQLSKFSMPGWDGIRPQSQQAVASLYRGMTGTLGEDVPTCLAALQTASQAQAAVGVQNGATYPNSDFANALKDLAAMLHAEVGLQVATVDVGGWDTHTDEVNDLDRNLLATAQALTAFMTDLGPERRKRVTMVVMTEFGRRVAQNASGGSDHGHGSVMWVLGGGLSGSGVFGNWTPLSAGVLDQGDVPGLNDPFDALGEVAQKRLSAGALDTVFPGHAFTPVGLFTAA